jgi:hypothetical protein
MDDGETTYIKIPYPSARDLHFKIIAPICPVKISPGLGNAWATGKYHDPKYVMPVSIRQSENVAEIVADGAFAYRAPLNYLPQLSLSFGRRKPFALSIRAGDISDQLNFGGLPLSALDIQYGTGDQIIDFSYPNPQVLKKIKVTADSSKIRIENFANANAEEIWLSGEGSSYQLNFGCEMKRSLSLHTAMSVSKVKVIIPVGTAVKIASKNPPKSNRPGDFCYVDKIYWTSPARENQEPLLSINNAASSSTVYIKFT